MSEKNNGLTVSIPQALSELKIQQGDSFDIQKVNLADLERLTGVSRAKLRRLKKSDFIEQPHGLTGRKAEKTVLTGYTDTIDDLLREGCTNSSICYEKIKEQGYSGSLTTVKNYISSHKHLVPAKRQIVAPKGNRGRRYQTDPGESFQMDWGFVKAEDQDGNTTRLACFAMICHCCGKFYIEFFPNARQENLFIGMIHAFSHLGVPKYILTDNMKSVLTGRDEQGHPIWQNDYELFMNNIGFETKVCKPRHPFTKGSVERLIRLVKENFLPGRIFHEVTDLNYEAERWCDQQNSSYHRSVDCVPDDKHNSFCMKTAEKLDVGQELAIYLCPERKISFDGFVNYEGRRFGVPYWYTEKTCRVCREGYTLTIYNSSMTQVLAVHDVTWSRKDSFCKDQYAEEQPEEKPTVPVNTHIQQEQTKDRSYPFDRFNFEEGLWNE